MQTTLTVDLDRLTAEIREVIGMAIEQEEAFADLLANVHPNYHSSARNLVHYLAMRTFDLRKHQEKLSMLGISAIGHSEAYTLSNLINIDRLLSLLGGNSDVDSRRPTSPPLDLYESKEQLKRNTNRVFGPGTRDGGSRIMVTMPAEAATDYDLIEDLFQAGMDIARINCSHDDKAAWQSMIHNIRQAEKEYGRTCLIYMDLSGPKLRTNFPPPPGQEKKKKPGLKLFRGDRVKVCRKAVSSVTPNKKKAKYTARVSTTLEDIFEDVQIGQRVFFDDGKMGGEVVETGKNSFIVEIGHVGLAGSKLRSDKGINLPDTTLRLPSLTEQDRENLPFIAEHADIVGYSFVRTPEDVHELQDALADLGRSDLGMVLKIETKESFDKLPQILLAAMRSPAIGVMIARGDLAVEIGFERIAEVQEEILWLCEAAHVPGIWATQVLEKLAKNGQASRAEVTDAAASARAECVMLNKGDYIVSAVEMLADIVDRMHKHQVKRKGSLRPLEVARRFF